MRQSLKIAISLLISVLLFSGFAVLAFTNLFTLIDAGFFQPRVREGAFASLATTAAAVGRYHDLNVERFALIAGSPGAAAQLGRSPGEAETRALEEALADLQRQVPGLVNVRIVTSANNLLHYSRLATDLRGSTAGETGYERLNDTDAADSLAWLATAAGAPEPQMLVDAARDRFVYALPVKGTDATALFYVGTLDLARELLRSATPGVNAVASLGGFGILVNAGTAERDAIGAGLLEAAAAPAAGTDPFSVPLDLESTRDPGTVEQVVVFAARAPRAGGGDWGWVARLEPRAAFEMGTLLKGLLLASFFVTVFLVTYLLFNLRSDPLDVVSQRVKRFQIQLLESLLEREGATDWGRWRGELERRREEITRQVQRGIGRVSKRQRPEIDAYIDKGWNEILDLLARRAETAPAPAALDVSRLENLIQQALKSASFVVPAQIIGAAPASGPRPVPRAAAPVRGAPIQVEELSADEVEDLPEAESVEEIPEASLEEPVAEVEEIPEIPEAAEGEGAPGPAAKPTPEAADAEEIPEAEEVLEAEEVAEAEEVTEAEEVLEAEEVAEADLPVEPAQAAGSPQTLETGMTIHVAETLVDTGSPAQTQPGSRARDEFLENLEELETVTEIEPLPPLPEEEGLEMLLPADDGGTADQPGVARSREGSSTGSSSGTDDAAAEEFEELEMLEEATDAGEEAWSEDDQRAELERLMGSGSIRTWTIVQLRKAADEARSAIVVENGVYRIKEEVYTARNRGGGRLKRIADEVVGHDAGARPAAEPGAEATAAGESAADAGFMGIVDLMRDAEPLDLAKVVGADSDDDAVPAHDESVGSKVLPLKRGGLDYDEFLAAYPRSFSHTTQMKSLVEVSRRVAAVSAGLLLRKADGWSPDLTIGLGDRTIAGLQFRKGEPFETLLLAPRLAVAVDRPPGEVRTIRVRIDPEDLRYAKRLLLLPATFRGQEACLLLAFAADSDVILENVLSSLQVQ